MVSVLLCVATGSEPIEVIGTVDALRRAEIEVTVASTVGELQVLGDANIPIVCDSRLEDVMDKQFNAVVIPGGFQGAAILSQNQTVVDLIKKFHAEGKLVASICDAPGTVLGGGCHMIEGVKCCGYPFSDSKITDNKGIKVEDATCFDQNILTSRCPATTLKFAIEIIKILKGEEAANNVFYGMGLNI